MHAATDFGQVYTTDYTVDFARVEMRDAASCRVDYTVDVNGDYTEDCGVDVQLSWPWSPLQKIILDDLKKPEDKIKKCLDTLTKIDKKNLFRELFIGGEEVNLRKKFHTTIDSDKKVLMEHVKDKAGAEDKVKAGADDKVSNKASDEELNVENDKQHSQLHDIAGLVSRLWGKLQEEGIKFPVLVRTFEHVGGEYKIKYYPIGTNESGFLKNQATVVPTRYYHPQYIAELHFKPKDAMILLRDAEFLINNYIYLRDELKKIQGVIKEFKIRKGVK